MHSKKSALGIKIVIIWASNNEEKYGNKILKDLIGKWYTVIPINPKEKEIEWIKTHKNLSFVKDFDIANFVVKPEITLQILKKYKDILKNKKIWIQPWASDENVEKFLKENDFSDYITNSCIMVNKIK